MPFRKQVSLGFFGTIGCSLLSIGYLFSEPSGFTLQSGDALPPVQKNGALVIENSSNSMIDWESFSIGLGEKVIFQQLHDTTYVLNRVTGGMESQLLGSLQSNGSVYLINPNGIVIGQDALIDTAGFIASTLDLVGNDLSEFVFSGDSDKGVINRGTIRSEVGNVFLIARAVENSGVVSTPQGRQGFLSGYDVLIRSERAPEVMIRADEIDRSLLEENPYALAIRHSGRSEGREVYLVADSGICEFSGEITAQKGDVGGEVRLLGDEVVLIGDALIDASGDAGGGVVLIGGDYQGTNPEVRNAKHVWASQDSLVKADALERGDGGKVVFWSDEATLHYGKISIRGGSEGGNGGMAEVSGKILAYRGFTDGKAPFGRAGSLLLDPNDIVVGASATTGTFSACVPPVTYNIDSGTATNEILNTDLQTQLGSCSVTISTVGSAGAGPNSGSITVSSAVTWATTNTLTLTAASYMVISAAISNTYNTDATIFDAMSFTANGTSAGANSGIALNAGAALSSSSTTTGAGNITLNGTAPGSGASVVHGVFFNTGTIATQGGNVSVTGALTGGSGTSVAGITMSSTDGITSTTGSITLTGTSATSGTSGFGVRVTAAWAAGTTGTLSFTNCLGSGSGGTGVVLNGSVSSANDIIMSGLQSGTASTSGSGLYTNSNITSTGGGNISLTAVQNTTAGGGLNSYGIFIDATCLVSTTGTGTITLNGTGSSSGTSGTTRGVAANGRLQTVSGAIQVTGTVPIGASAVGIGIYLFRTAGTNVITSTSGPITLSGTSLGTGTSSFGVNIALPWTTGTSGTVTFDTCTGGSGASSHGIHLNFAFITSGSVVATNMIRSGTGSASFGFSCGDFTTSGTNSTIQITAQSLATAGQSHGINVGRSMSTSGGGSITLSGIGGPSSSGNSNGIRVAGSPARISTATGNGNISLTGSASSPGGASYGILLVGTNAAMVNSTSGAITLTGTSTATATGSYGVWIASSWTPATTGSVTFIDCTGSNTGTSHGVYIGATFTGSGPVIFSNCTGGIGGSNGVNIAATFTTAGNVTGTSLIGQGNGGIGFFSNQTFSVTGASSSISITASSEGTTGSCHGISLTGGTLRTTNGGGITLNGTGGASDAASHGINITGGASTISTTTGNGSISITGAALGASVASFGINIAGSAAGVINSTTGTMTLTGTSTAAITGSHGVSLAAAWIPATTGLITFTGCTGSDTGASHGVNMGTAFTGSGPVTFSSCTGGSGGSNGVNIAATFSTVGSVTGTSLIGQGAGGIGFFSDQTFSVTGASNSINIAASSSGVTGNCYGISLTGGSMSTDGGGGITLNGTGGASDAASHGINITGGASTITTATGDGTISLTGAASGNNSGFGINITGGAANVITSSSGSITANGASTATGSGSYGVNIGAAFNPATSSTLSLIGSGGSGSDSHGINVGFALSNTGPISLTGTAGAGSFGNSLGANLTTIGGAISVSGSTILAVNTIIDTTNSGGTPAGASISFTGTSTTIDGTTAYTENLTLLAGSGGAVTFGGAIGSITPLGDLTITSAKTTSNAVNINSNITANNFIITTVSPVTITGSSVINTSGLAGSPISFPATVDGSTSGGQNLTLNSGAGSITLTGAVGSTVSLGALTITNANNVTASSSIAASSLTQAAGTGTTLFSGSLTIGSNIALTGNNFTFNAPVLSANNVTIVNGGLLSISSAGDMSLSGAFLQSGAGLVQTAGDITTTNQNIEFDSGVTLTGDVVLNTGGAPGDVTFLSTVDGARGLEVNGGNVTFGANVGDTPLSALQITATGTVTADGDIDLSGGAGLSGGNLNSSSGGTTTCAGEILSKGGDDLAGTGGNGGSVTIVSTGGSISVHNINTSGGAGTVSGGSGGAITLQPASGYSGGYPIGLIVLNSDLSIGADGNLVSIAGSGGGGSGGTITMSANRSTPATVATITSSLSGNDISITGANIVMGLDEAMTGLGSITLTASDLTLGDLVALTDLTIVGVNINLRLHGDESILSSTGLLYITPSLHFLSGGTYLQVGALIPADGTLNAQSLSLTPTQFRPDLLFSGHILNFDPTFRPVPFVASEASKQYVIYLLLVADAQLSDLLPIYWFGLYDLYDMCNPRESDCGDLYELIIPYRHGPP